VENRIGSDMDKERTRPRSAIFLRRVNRVCEVFVIASWIGVVVFFVFGVAFATFLFGKHGLLTHSIVPDILGLFVAGVHLLWMLSGGAHSALWDRLERMPFRVFPRESVIVRWAIVLAIVAGALLSFVLTLSLRKGQQNKTGQCPETRTSLPAHQP